MSRQPQPLARKTDLIVQPADQETVIYDSVTNKAYVLNSTAAAVWRASNGERNVREIATYLSQETPTTEQTVWYALGQLSELLEEPVTLPQEMVGVSRRKFLKMSGAVAAGVAIPMVVKLVAPTPAAAQSPGGGVCCECSGAVTIFLDAASCADCASRCQSVGLTSIGCFLRTCIT